MSLNVRREPTYAIYQPDQSVVDKIFIACDEVRYANGAYLTGYFVGEGYVATRWRLSGPVPVTYQATVQVFDDQGIRLTQADRLSWPGGYWRLDDTLYLWFTVDVPVEAAMLFVGMYTVDEGGFTNVEVIDQMGGYLGQGAELPVTVFR